MENTAIGYNIYIKELEEWNFEDSISDKAAAIKAAEELVVSWGGAMPVKVVNTETDCIEFFDDGLSFVPVPDPPPLPREEAIALLRLADILHVEHS